MQEKVKRKTKNVKRKIQKREYKKQKTLLPAQALSLGGKTSRITLPPEIFGVKIKPQTLAQAVRVYLANQRKGTVSTKTRAEVRGGGRKPWRQKGTGRARQGSIRAPHWRGGGIVFGPKPRDFSLKIPAKVKQKILFGAISEKFSKGEVKIVDNFEKVKPETKELVRAMKKFELDSKRILWVVSNQSENLVRAGRNLPNLEFHRVENLSAFKVLACETLIFNKSAIEKLMFRLRSASSL